MNNGAFVWYDLATTDPEAAGQFYKGVVGWAVEPVPEMHYTLFKVGETRATGMMSLPPHLREAGVPPHWCGYIMVDDVDSMADKVKQHGGSLKFGPEDIPGVGRFAAMTDPQGPPFYLFKANGDEQADPGLMKPGHVGWHELITKDYAKAFEFYGPLFGWEQSRAIDMGPMGTYQLFGYGGADQGGMMNCPPGVPAHWMFYFVVEGIDAAKARIESAGGTVRNGPMEVPGGAWVVSGQDPQGAAFALVSATK